MFPPSCIGLCTTRVVPYCRLVDWSARQYSTTNATGKERRKSTSTSPASSRCARCFAISSPSTHRYMWLGSVWLLIHQMQ